MAKPNLLIADADPRSLHILELALRKAGFSVATVADGTQALQRVLASPPDLLICEAALPFRDGLSLCKEVRAAHPALPVIITSADKSLAARALEAGADEFLRKPILLKELVRRAQTLLEAREFLEAAATDCIRGSVRDLGLVDALQSLAATRTSAVVSCEAYGRTARLWVRGGQLVDAELGPLIGEPAFFRLMTWESGSFRVEPQAVDREPRIEGGTEAALVEAMRRTEELAAADLPMTSIFSVDYLRLADRLADLPDEVNGVLRCFDGHRTLREAIDLSPADDLGTLLVVRRLTADGILCAVESKKTALKPSLQEWLSDPPPVPEQPPPMSLEAARTAAALVEEMEEVEAIEVEEDHEAEAEAAARLARRALVKALPVVHFPPLRGVRRERLRREAEEARARIGEGQAVRLSRVVELPAFRPDGSDALLDARRMSPAVGAAAKKFAPDAPVARLLNGDFFHRAAQLSHRLKPAAVEPRETEPEPPATVSEPPAPVTEPPAPVTALPAPVSELPAPVSELPAPVTALPAPVMTLPVAPVAQVTPPIAPVAQVTPAIAALAPGTPPPDRGFEAAMQKARQPSKRRWGWSAAFAAALLGAAFLLRRQPGTDKKDAPWLTPVAVERVAPPPPTPGPAVAASPRAAEPQPAAAPAPDQPPGAAPAPDSQPAVAPASDQLYSKALELGEKQLRSGKYKQAIAHFQRAVKERPQAVPALLALGDACLEADRPRSALQPLEEAARLDQRSGRAQLLLGTAYQSLGKNAQAVLAFRRYLELEPEGEFSRDVRVILANLAH